MRIKPFAHYGAHISKKNNWSTVLLRINAGGVHLIFDIFGGCLFKGGV